MKRIIKELGCFAVLLVGLSVTRADSPSVARFVFFTAKPGGKAKLEEAIKKQMDQRREQNEDWRWLTWEYVSGEEGRYGVATFGHTWQDYDQPKVSPCVEALDTLGTLSARPAVIQYFDHLEEVSAMGTEKEVPTVAEIAVFDLQFGRTKQFYAAVRQFHRAMQQSGATERYEWFELLSGGSAPQFMLFLPRRNWAGFDTDRGLLSEALEKSLGKRKAEKVTAEFSAAVKSYHRLAVRLRPDLSKLQSGETAK